MVWILGSLFHLRHLVWSRRLFRHFFTSPTRYYYYYTLGLIAAGEDPDSPAIQRAVHFLLSKQNENGGWGETYLACVNKDYPEDGAGELGDDQSGIVQTAWALLALMAAECEDREAIDDGIAYLMSKQLPSGDWPQGPITGVFNRSCGITYTAYRNVFPIWALGRYANKYN